MLRTMVLPIVGKLCVGGHTKVWVPGATNAHKNTRCNNASVFSQ